MKFFRMRLFASLVIFSANQIQPYQRSMIFPFLYFSSTNPPPQLLQMHSHFNFNLKKYIDRIQKCRRYNVNTYSYLPLPDSFEKIYLHFPV